MHVSIVICCYNSASRIVPTLEHLAAQILNGLSCEVILVDNNCTDDTVDVARNIWCKLDSPFPLKIVVEKEPGLSYARKAGVHTAQGEIIVFCDDDNWLAEEYCIRAYEILNSNKKIGATGGKSIFVSDLGFILDNTVQEKLGLLAIGKQLSVSGIANERGFLWGAGFAIKTEILKKIYKSNLGTSCSDRKGKNLSSGNDSELCQLIMIMNFDLFYSENLLFKHYITANRLNIDYLNKLFKALASRNDILILLDSYRFYRNYTLKKLFMRYFILLLKLTSNKSNMMRIKVVYNLILYKIFNHLNIINSKIAVLISLDLGSERLNK